MFFIWKKDFESDVDDKEIMLDFTVKPTSENSQMNMSIKLEKQERKTENSELEKFSKKVNFYLNDQKNINFLQTTLLSNHYNTKDLEIKFIYNKKEEFEEEETTKKPENSNILTNIKEKFQKVHKSLTKKKIEYIFKEEKKLKALRYIDNNFDINLYCEFVLDGFKRFYKTTKFRINKKIDKLETLGYEIGNKCFNDEKKM